MSRNSDYAARILLDYSYHQVYYKLTGINLLKQTNTNIPQQHFLSQENEILSMINQMQIMV